MRDEYKLNDSAKIISNQCFKIYYNSPITNNKLKKRVKVVDISKNQLTFVSDIPLPDIIDVEVVITAPYEPEISKSPARIISSKEDFINKQWFYTVEFPGYNEKNNTQGNH